MKTTNNFLPILSIILFIIYSTSGAYYFPAPECVKDSYGYYDDKMLSPVSKSTRCRVGQNMKIVSTYISNIKTSMCCCKWKETFSLVQTSDNELNFYANTCEFKNDSTVPTRKSLLTTGSDLHCFGDEKLQNFKAEINGKIRDMSCCMKISKLKKNATAVVVESEQVKNGTGPKVNKIVVKKIIIEKIIKKKAGNGTDTAIAEGDQIKESEVKVDENGEQQVIKIEQQQPQSEQHVYTTTLIPKGEQQIPKIELQKLKSEQQQSKSEIEPDQIPISEKPLVEFEQQLSKSEQQTLKIIKPPPKIQNLLPIIEEQSVQSEQQAVINEKQVVQTEQQAVKTELQAVINEQQLSTNTDTPKLSSHLDQQSIHLTDQKVTLIESEKIPADTLASSLGIFDADDDVTMAPAVSSTTLHKKLRGQASVTSLPEFTAASECVYATETSTQPVAGYMSYDEPDTTLGCRSQQKMINMTTINNNDGNSYDVYCCKFDSSLLPINPAPLIIANECEYDADGVLHSYSGLKPGSDLVCDTNTHELITVTTNDVISHKPVTVSCCNLKADSTKVTSTTKSFTTSSTTFVPSPSFSQAGSECVYLRDGSLKVHYMDYCEDNPVCRSQQFMKKSIKDYYERCCCQDDLTLPPSKTTTILKAPDCVPKNDQEMTRWSIIRSGSDLICNRGYKINEVMIFENGAPVSMSCCTVDDGKPDVKITTTTTQKPIDTETTPASQALPTAGTQCTYNEDRTLKTSFMDNCTPNLVCRSKEVKLEVFVSMPDNTQVKKCCCDYRKELTANSSAGPSIIAPKCFYDQEGYINPWSVVETGNDLGCVMADNLMTFDLGNDISKMSCCLKKDAVTIPTTMRTTPMTSTSSMFSTSTSSNVIESSTISIESTSTTTVELSTTTLKPDIPTVQPSNYPANSSFKFCALECVYLKNGSLNVDFMDFYHSQLTCRSQYVMKRATIRNKYREVFPKACCDFSKTLPFNSSWPPIIAPSCSFMSKTGEIYRWSVARSGPDLICEPDHFMYNTTIFSDGVETPFSCCQPVNKPIPTLRPTSTVGTTVVDSTTVSSSTVSIMHSDTTTSSSTTTFSPQTTVNLKGQVHQAAPICKYREDKSLFTDYMETCSSSLICRSQETMVEQKAAAMDESTVNLCCCDSRPDLPPTPLNISVTAPKCHFDTNGNIVVYSVILYGPELTCDNTDELKNYTMEMSSGNQTMSCCLQIGTMTIATTARTYGTTESVVTSSTATEASQATIPQVTETTVKPTSTIIPSITATSKAVTKSDSTDMPTVLTTTQSSSDSTSTKSQESSTSLDPTKSDSTTVSNVTPDSSISSSTMPSITTVTATLKPDDSIIPAVTTIKPVDTTPSSPVTTVIPIMTTIPTTTKGGKQQDKPISVPTEGVSTVDPALPNTISTVLPSETTSAVTTTVGPKPTGVIKKKRTVPPKKANNSARVVKPGECPDCLYPEAGPVDSLQMAIKHLQMPGPKMGKCPTQTHTMRLIMPKPDLGLLEGRCCCENDKFPLPYSFD